jgi:molecular chaperone DnaJ
VAVDHYEVLGVSRDASDDDIRRAYRKLARNSTRMSTRTTARKRQFKLVTHAYEVSLRPGTALPL